jgi:Uncharacterised nucleotidyltransferase
MKSGARLPKSTTRRKLFELLAEIVLAPGPLSTCTRVQSANWDDPELWWRLLTLAKYHDVLPAIARPLEASGALRRAPHSLGNVLIFHNRANRTRNIALLSQGRAVLQMLAAADVQALPLKGLAYQIIGLYADDPGRRPSADIDVLVPIQSASRAQAVLISDGYRPYDDADSNHFVRHHHLPKLKPISSSGAPVEIHFHVVNERFAALLPAQEFFSTASGAEAKEASAPSAARLLDHAIIHGSLQDAQYLRRTIRLRDVSDIRRLWDRLVAGGVTVADLRAMQDERARCHFGACLLLAGIDPSKLDTLEIPARNHLGRVLARQAVAERSIEAKLYGFWDLFQKQRSEALKKLIAPCSYRKLLGYLRSTPT